MNDEGYETVVIGTGFASTFFLREYLKHAPEGERILVLERGRKHDPMDQIKRRRNSDISFNEMFINRTPNKGWVQNIAFGGGTCWTGNTPRMHPNDFKTRSLYGVGDDWPVDYAQLDPCYQEVEDAMGISGPENTLFPRSKPYPLPPHRLNALDREFVRKYPGLHIPMPTARASTPAAGRPVCCSNGVCSLCPIGSKFQVDRHLAGVYDDPRVTLRLGAGADRVEIAGGVVRGVHYTLDGREHFARCNLAAVGAHAIMSPFLLLRSGLDDPALGRYLNEQISIDVDVLLDGVQNYDGSQRVTGLGLMGLDGPSRAHTPGYLLENWNVPWLRAESGRWRERGFVKFVFEELPSPDNYVAISSEDPSKPEVYYGQHSEYGRKGVAALESTMQEIFSGLPIEDHYVHPFEYGMGGSAHIQGTTRMGTDPKTSVVDGDLRHHRVRNLLALGSGAFPTCPAANPTLTLSALSVWAARRLFA